MLLLSEMMKLLRTLLFLLLIPTGLHAQFEKVFETPQPRRIRALEAVRSTHYSTIDPATQITVYTALKALAEKQRDPQSVLYANALLASAHVWLDTTRINEYTYTMKALIDQSIVSGNEILHAQLLMCLVDDLGQLNRVGASLGYYILADDIMDRLDPQDTPRALYGLRHDLIMHLYEIGDYTQARKIMDKVSHMKVHPDYRLFYADLHSQILLQLHLYDSSAYYIMKARDILDHDTAGVYNKGWYGILEGNMAKINYYKKEYALAIPSLQKAVAITYDASLFENTALFGLLLANCYNKTNESEEIKPLIPVIRRSVYLQFKDEHYIDLYKLMLVMPDRNITPERALELLDSIDIRKHTLALRNDYNLLTKKEMEKELAVYQERQSVMSAKIKEQLMWRNLLWGALACALVVSLMVFYKGNKRFRMEQDRSRLLQEQTELELSASRDQLRLFTSTIQEKSRQIEMFENNIDVNQQNETLEHLRQNTILTEDEWSRFKSLFEKAYPGFFARANHQFPNLTTGEMRFIALIKLGFTTREMASTLGVSPVSVRSIRSRLLKKLNLAENENLAQMVSVI